jgi:hypothetical protein
VFGTSSNTYTMSGLTSSASKQAQGSPTHLVTSNQSGDLAAYTPHQLGLASQSDVNSLGESLGHRIDVVGNRADKALSGVAMAFAAAGVPTVLPNERFAFTGNWGTYQGQNGFAIDGAVRLGTNIQLNGAVAWGVEEDGAAGRAGVRVGW